ALEAAAKLKDQKDIVDAAAALKVASDRQNALVAAALKIVEERKVAAKTATDVLAAANAQVADLTSKVAAATATVEERYAQFRDATTKWQLDDVAADRVAKRAADSKALVNYALSHDKIAANQAEHAKLNAELAAAK